MNANPRFGRRTAIKSLVPLATGGAAAAALLRRASAPAVAVSDSGSSRFEAADAPTVERNDGRVSAVTLAPEIDVDWRNFGEGVDEVSLTLAASVDDAMDVLAEPTLGAEASSDAAAVAEVDGSFDDVDGTLSVSFEPLDVTEVGEEITAETFGDPELEAGETATTPVEVLLGVDVYGHQGERAEAVETATFEVTVRNPDGEAGLGGRANPDAS
ncbi:MAG: hypothetical protein ACOCZD_01990 [Haloferacaceae archaeon]